MGARPPTEGAVAPATVPPPLRNCLCRHDVEPTTPPTPL